jgi:hypothetical protein
MHQAPKFNTDAIAALAEDTRRNVPLPARRGQVAAHTPSNAEQVSNSGMRAAEGFWCFLGDPTKAKHAETAEVASDHAPAMLTKLPQIRYYRKRYYRKLCAE